MQLKSFRYPRLMFLSSRIEIYFDYLFESRYGNLLEEVRKLLRDCFESCFAGYLRGCINPSIFHSIAPHQLFLFASLLQYYYCPWCRVFRVRVSLFFPIRYYPSFSKTTHLSVYLAPEVDPKQFPEARPKQPLKQPLKQIFKQFSMHSNKIVNRCS